MFEITFSAATTIYVVDNKIEIIFSFHTDQDFKLFSLCNMYNNYFSWKFCTCVFFILYVLVILKCWNQNNSQKIKKTNNNQNTFWGEWKFLDYYPKVYIYIWVCVYVCNIVYIYFYYFFVFVTTKNKTFAFYSWCLQDFSRRKT